MTDKPFQDAVMLVPDPVVLDQRKLEHAVEKAVEAARKASKREGKRKHSSNPPAAEPGA